MRDEVETSPSFFETRRRLLWLPVWVTASAAFARAERISTRQESMTNATTVELDWEAFLKQCVPTAETLFKDSSPRGQDAYLHWLASMIARVQPHQIPRAKTGRFGKLDPPVHFGISYRGKPFFIVEWRLEPDAYLPPHCHPNASVCTLGLEGEARIRNFEIVGQAPEFSSRQTFLVRETHNEVIASGRVNTLSSTRDNIHTFQAGKAGARGIDISSLHGADVGFSFLDIAEKAREKEGRVFEAAWKGREV
ncbi:MAG TPA: hypothetical protein VKA70_21070 [Blastocatellia bacterium]|nr:hypothetical protein [Blastocatellia bacterium]